MMNGTVSEEKEIPLEFENVFRSKIKIIGIENCSLKPDCLAETVGKEQIND